MKVRSVGGWVSVSVDGGRLLAIAPAGYLGVHWTDQGVVDCGQDV